MSGYSADNIAFGMGGGLLQHVNRDTMKFAMKCSAIVKDGHVVEVYKDPITDQGKKSKKGLSISTQFLVRSKEFQKELISFSNFSNI